MRLATYTPADFGDLQRAAERIGPHSSLGHRPFVDYYYTTRDSCRLYLARDDNDAVVGTLGVELLNFQFDARALTIGFGSNYEALAHGAGGHLFLKWMKSAPIGAVFGGSADTHRVIGSQKWTYFGGVATYHFNRVPRARPNEPAWRVAAKRIVRAVQRPVPLQKRLRCVPAHIRVREEGGYAEDLLPQTSPFRFRFAPTVEDLRWRYNTTLTFVRYRVFSILDDGRTAGYVILNDGPERVLVAQCDADNAGTLAYGVLRSLAVATASQPRELLLTTSHPEMQRIYESAGFVRAQQERPFALGTLRRPLAIDADTSNWLINFDWTDNGLRVPFLDQQSGAKASECSLGSLVRNGS